MPVYRRRTRHELQIPVYLRPILHTRSYVLTGPDELVLGGSSKEGTKNGEAGIFHRLGMNDDFSTKSLVSLMKKGKLPDFTMVYFPDNDRRIHKYGVDELSGLVRVGRQHLQTILHAYGNWNETLQHLTLVVMGDSGVSVYPKRDNPTIRLKDSFPNTSV